MKLIALLVFLFVSCTSVPQRGQERSLYQSINEDLITSGARKTQSEKYPKSQPGKRSYSRALYKHWIDEDGDCQDTRAEILIRYNVGDLKFKDDHQCVVVSGRWKDPYSGRMFTEARQLDIDHIIPLKKAHEIGGHSWDAEKRRKFANDPENLLPVWNRLNRRKGAKGPSEWLPPKHDYVCEYLERWEHVKAKYGLKQIKREIASIKEKLKSCK